MDLNNNENVNALKKQVEQTEAEIRVLTERIKAMEPEKEQITTEFNAQKANFESFKRKYAEQSTYGIYFLAVSFIAFVYVTIKVLNNSLVSFMFWPALILLVVAIAGKIMGDQKFHKMKAEMGDKEMAYAETKHRYDEFMAIYNADADELERKHYEWESAENDRIEAKKDAWIAEQKKRQAAEVQE
ncbi:MAG: hypothetical protein IKR27_05375 [Lachnospiraceae bacterium]|nr:hypothetical protein [Lachnospiraceae bacterium]